MRAIGATTHSHIRTIYTIAAMIAGAAGAVLAQSTETVSLEVLGFQRSADVLVMLILGGTGRLYGGLLGAVVYMVARDQFSGLNPQYWYFWIGLLLIAVVVVLPNGLLGGLSLLTRRAKAQSWVRVRWPLAASIKDLARSSSPPTSTSLCRPARVMR
jgi:branched-chain amino acid transport system permease protein